MIITIARKCGCDADSIGRAVAEKYHLHFMNREAIAASAKEAGCYDEYEEFYSERPVNSLLYSIVMETEEDNVADTHGVSARKAKTVVRETNDNRKTYHKYYTGQEWGQAENYDLCLNVAKLGVDGVIAMIDSFIQNRK